MPTIEHIGVLVTRCAIGPREGRRTAKQALVRALRAIHTNGDACKLADRFIADGRRAARAGADEKVNRFTENPGSPASSQDRPTA